MATSEVGKSRQHSYLYLGVVAPVAVVVGMFVLFRYPPTVLLGAVPPVAVLLAHALGSGETTDREDASEHAVRWAFLLLLGLFPVDWFLGLIPGTVRPTVYAFVGGASFFLFYLYYRYL
jgi:hypothetical protein